MILQALTRYYEILRNDPNVDIAPFGYSAEKVSFALNISADGELLDIFPLSRILIVPEYTEPTSNIQASFLCGKSDYVLGFSKKDKEKPEHSRKRFLAFKKFNVELLKQVNAPAAKATIKFLEAHDPKTATLHPVIQPYLSDLLRGGRIVFLYQGTFVHDYPAIRQAWDNYFAQSDAVTMQCLVTGKESHVAIKHRKIKGKVGRQNFASPLVSFNQRAFESYNRTKKQGLNSPISREAEFAYTRVLNFLLSEENPYKKFRLGDAVLVYWAEHTDTIYGLMYGGLIDPGDLSINQDLHEERAHFIEAVASKITKADPIDISSLLDDLEENPKFYILGLAPVGDGRLQIRFFFTDLFGNILENVVAHYRDTSIKLERDDYSQRTLASIGNITRTSIPATVIKEDARNKHRESLAPMLANTFYAMLANTPYPASLFYTVMNRIRSEFTINGLRVGLIKAYLLRKRHHHSANPFKEVLIMALNEQSTHPAYVLGRLFAWLERAQQAAIGQNINATIKDRYFTSACATPASVFPILLRLAHHHFSKAEYGRYIENQVESLLTKLEGKPFPARLTLDEQGVFILGYYHQRAAFYTKNSEEAEETAESEQ